MLTCRMFAPSFFWLVRLGWEHSSSSLIRLSDYCGTTYSLIVINLQIFFGRIDSLGRIEVS